MVDEKKEKEERKGAVVLPTAPAAAPAQLPTWIPGPLKDLWAGIDSLTAGLGAWKTALGRGLLLGAGLAALVQLVIHFGSARPSPSGDSPKRIGFFAKRGSSGGGQPANEGLFAAIPGIYSRLFAPAKPKEPAATREDEAPESTQADGGPAAAFAALAGPFPAPELGGAPGRRLERMPGFGERSGGGGSGGSGGGGGGPGRGGGGDGPAVTGASGAGGSSGAGGAGVGATSGLKNRRGNVRRAAGGRQGLNAGSAREQLGGANALAGEARFQGNEAAAGSISAAFDGRAIGGPGASVGGSGAGGSLGKDSGVGGGGMGGGAAPPGEEKVDGGGNPMGGGSGTDKLDDNLTETNVTPWQKEVSKAKGLIIEADGLKSDGRMYIVAGVVGLGIAWKTPMPWQGILVTAALGLITKGYADYKEGNAKLEEVRVIADGLVERYDQKDQARILENGMITAGTGLPMKDPAACGYAVDMDSKELDRFMKCMSASASRTARNG